MDQVSERIAAWEAAGLIDPATAGRLRLAEADRLTGATASAASPVEGAPGGRRGPSSFASIFGPGVTIGEMFAYLGGAFLLGAYETFIIRGVRPGDDAQLAYAIAWAAAAATLAALGLALRTGDARRRRAAGVMFALAVAHVAAAGAAIGGSLNLDWPAIGVVSAGAASLAAIGLRLLHPSLLTQVALLSSVTAMFGVLLDFLQGIVVPDRQFTELGEPIATGGPDPVVLAVVAAAWWLAVAVIIGVVGLAEGASADHDPGAARRASVTRLWAGLVAVIGLSSAVMRSDYLASGEYGRVIEPFVGDLAILVLAAVLVERAFRRDASTFVFAAALGLIIALSDFNFAYLSTSPEVGLLIEGVILLAAGVAADRLRRGLGRRAKAVDAEVPMPVAPA